MSKPFNLSKMTSEEIKFLTKPLATYNNTLIDQDELERMIKLSHPRTWAGVQSYNYHLDSGKLAELPLEVLFLIFTQTDIQSLMYLRATNSSLKLLIESWGPFQAAMNHAQPAVRALIATNASKLWTFSQLETIIYTSKCSFCGEHAEILHLLKLRRVCFNCLTTDRRLLAVDRIELTQVMGLTDKEITQTPSLIEIPQNRFWGLAKQETFTLYDYTAAVALAMSRYRRKKPRTRRPNPNTQIRVRFGPERVEIPDDMRKHTNPYKVQKPLCIRRLEKRNRVRNKTQRTRLTDLPTFLFNPPESHNFQHACSVHLPARRPPTLDAPSTIIPALLCAGCSFYFNYHNALPHQTHTLYAYTTLTPPPSNTPITSPLLSHLQTCHYARQYWTNLYPNNLNPDPQSDNPRLQSNGGPSTSRDIAREAIDHRLATLVASSAAFRHFPRHIYDRDDVTRLGRAENNHSFEMIPASFLDTGRAICRIPRRTGLDLELEQKAQMEDKEIMEILDASYDEERLDEETRTQIRRIRDKKEAAAVDKTDYEVDMYGDVLLANTSTVSQANWATASVESSNCLFRGWSELLLERKQKQEQYEARARGRGIKRIEVGGRGWGFDRFGCVSDLG